MAASSTAAQSQVTDDIKEMLKSKPLPGDREGSGWRLFVGLTYKLGKPRAVNFFEFVYNVDVTVSRNFLKKLYDDLKGHDDSFKERTYSDGTIIRSIDAPLDIIYDSLSSIGFDLLSDISRYQQAGYTPSARVTLTGKKNKSKSVRAKVYWNKLNLEIKLHYPRSQHYPHPDQAEPKANYECLKFNFHIYSGPNITSDPDDLYEQIASKWVDFTNEIDNGSCMSKLSSIDELAFTKVDKDNSGYQRGGLISFAEITAVTPIYISLCGQPSSMPTPN